ncbi:MAG: alanine racemase [Patescibacteria group bacterium]|jgi:alanine racemase
MLSWVEINRSALEHNLKNFRNLIGKATLLIPVIKSNAYGHGIAEVAKICDELEDVDRLAVVNLDEALLLRMLNIKKPIQILSFFSFDIQKAGEAMKKNVIFPVYTLKQAIWLNTVAERIGQRCKIHIKIDSGTTRIGFFVSELEDFLKNIQKLKHIEIEGVWSHFSSSETDYEITREQNRIFDSAIGVFKKIGICVPIRHISCSAATILHPVARYDAVRIGLCSYGLYPDKKSRKKINLKPVLSWKTTVIQVKNVKKGTGISYGNTYKMPKNGKIAIIPVGYYDGYDRAWSNKAEVLINGKRCPVRGRVCMNLTMIDVSKLKNCKEGSIVTLIGADGKEEITADDLTALTPETINYEIVTRINPLIRRIVV